ncbi:uncharacterized protein LOC144100990 isoform X2 [Amblyomma americanum]
MCTMVFVVAVGAILVALILAGGPGTETTEQTDLDSNPPGGVHVPGSHDNHRTTSTTGQTSPVATAATPTRATAPPRYSMDIEPLVCTMGSRTNSKTMFPEDGLCEYIFFDSVYKDRRNLMSDSTGWAPDLSTFVEVNRQYSTTAFGVGFAFEKAEHVVLNLKATNPPPLKVFWDKEIYHFGIVDTPAVGLYQENMNKAFECLKHLRQHASQKNQEGHMSYIVFAASFPDDTWAAYYADQFKNVFQPDLFIAHGHYLEGDNSRADCRVMPPTALTAPQGGGSSYEHDMTTAVDSLPELDVPGIVRTVFAISVTMKGRWSTPLPGQPTDFLSRCSQNLSAAPFGSLEEVCNDPNFAGRFAYSQQEASMQALHSRERLILSYDNEVGLCKKLCTVKARQPSRYFGVAVFDLDYEDFSNACASMNREGAFSRLHAVRGVLNYFRTAYKTAADEAGCLRLIT